MADALTFAHRVHASLPARVRTSSLVRAPAQRLNAWEDERETRGLIERVRPFSMVPDPALQDLIDKVRQVDEAEIPGDLVECGVWRGGSAFLMAEILKRRGDATRKVWMFDSFEGLPPPLEIDGLAAKAYAEDHESPWYYDNCRAGLEEVRANAQALGVRDRTRMVPGWFDETLPENVREIGPIALLRLDCDWHESVTVCLETLYDSVSPGGLVIVDDYYFWDGCAIAVHEFLVRRALAHRIEGAAGVAWFWKAQ